MALERSAIKVLVRETFAAEPARGSADEPLLALADSLASPAVLQSIDRSGHLISHDLQFFGFNLYIVHSYMPYLNLRPGPELTILNTAILLIQPRSLTIGNKP